MEAASFAFPSFIYRRLIDEAKRRIWMNRFMVSLSRHCLCARLTSRILNGKRIKSLRIHKISREYFIVSPRAARRTMNDRVRLYSNAHCLIHKELVMFVRVYECYLTSSRRTSYTRKNKIGCLINLTWHNLYNIETDGRKSDTILLSPIIF